MTDTGTYVVEAVEDDDELLPRERAEPGVEVRDKVGVGIGELVSDAGAVALHGAQDEVQQRHEVEAVHRHLQVDVQPHLSGSPSSTSSASSSKS
jgi:hypothetical protein